MLTPALLVADGFRYFTDPFSRCPFFQKAVLGRNGERLFFVNVYQYDFTDFKKNGYVGQDFVYEIQMQFETRDSRTVNIKVSVDPEDTPLIVETRARIIWLDLEGVPYDNPVAV